MADIGYIQASDGSGEAVRANVTVLRASGATSLQVDSVLNWPDKFIATSGTLDSDGLLDAETILVFKGHLSGTTIEIDEFAPGYTDNGNIVGQVVVIKPTTPFADEIVEAFRVAHNDDGTLDGDAVQSALTGYTPLAVAPTTVTANGNRSYSLTFPGVDYTDRLSPGMRLRTVRTVAAPNQCATFDGTNDYFSKSSPAGMTFTDDFAVSAWVKVTSYSAGGIISRYNGTSGWSLIMDGDGNIRLTGYNASVSNYSQIETIQSIPLNKWVHIAAQLDMSAFTATATTSYIMMDGVEVPSAVARGGTNPTSLVQAGNLEIGSWNGGGIPINGKIAQVAVFSAKVTQATMRGYMSQGLTGSETSLISAYSFNNSVADLKTSNANNLTANGGVLATSADSPFGGQADGTISTTKDYAIIQKVSFSTDTTAVVQVPIGCTIPTSGGVTSVSYSQFKAPYGFPAKRTLWRIANNYRTTLAPTSNVTYGSFQSGGVAITVPIGAFRVGQRGCYTSATTTSIFYNLSPVSLTGLDLTAGAALSPTFVPTKSAAASNTAFSADVSADYDLTVATTFTMQTLGASASGAFDGTAGLNELYAENAYI